MSTPAPRVKVDVAPVTPKTKAPTKAEPKKAAPPVTPRKEPSKETPRQSPLAKAPVSPAVDPVKPTPAKTPTRRVDVPIARTPKPVSDMGPVGGTQRVTPYVPSVTPSREPAKTPTPTGEKGGRLAAGGCDADASREPGGIAGRHGSEESRFEY